MNRSLAKLSFQDRNHLPSRVKQGFKWCTNTNGCSPNDWSIFLYFTEDVQSDNTAKVEISFLMPTAEYLLQVGAKFKIFSGSINQDLTVEVIETLEPLAQDRFGSP
jgi:hypothetical protein